jgi:hypothetical protein
LAILKTGGNTKKWGRNNLPVIIPKNDQIQLVYKLIFLKRLEIALLGLGIQYITTIIGKVHFFSCLVAKASPG